MQKFTISTTFSPDFINQLKEQEKDLACSRLLGICQTPLNKSAGRDWLFC
ncbi:MAG: hypothetical protein NTY00_09985 [Deltaproteobacteria bacterium]|nr:hypothetical protein [Deltaproteobacteria bacterium]